MDFIEPGLFRLPSKEFEIPGVNGSIINKPNIIEIKEEIYNKSGQFTLNKHVYILGQNQSIDGVKINTPELYERGGKLYYINDSNGKYEILNGSLMEQTLITSMIKYKQSKESKIPTNKITQPIKQLIGNKVSEVDYITKIKFDNPTTILQKNGQMISLMIIVGGLWYVLK